MTAFLADSLVSELLPYVNSNEQLITQFKAKFTCIYCGKKNLLEEYTKPFKVIPLLSPPADSREVSAGGLLTKFLNTPFQTQCPAPCHGMNDAKYHPVIGKFTFLGMNRRDDEDWEKKLLTKVTAAGSGKWGDNFCRELISAVMHRGSIKTGHFVTYSKAQDSWYLNDDSKRVKHTTHPLRYGKRGETAELLIYKNF